MSETGAVATQESRSRPRKLGNFEVLDEIGQGGMGVVFLARQPALERLVVLKKMQPDLAGDPGMVERFQREARAAAAVHHQNVVAVYDCFRFRDDHYIAQELVDGEDLRTILRRAGRLSPSVAQRIALEVARGLEEIHARGIVHRDLKPANVLVGRGGEIKIADFGIALEPEGDGLTRPGSVMGSVPYLSPEQMLAERVDCRSDLFLFGILLYEMVAGVPPFTASGDDAEDTLLERVQNGRYVPPRRAAPGLPRFLARLIRACLRANPSRRPQSAALVRRQLERHLGAISPADCRAEIRSRLAEGGWVRVEGDRTEPAPAGAPAPLARSWTRAIRWPAAAAAVGVGLALAVAVYAFGLASRGTADEPVPGHPARLPASMPEPDPEPAPAGPVAAPVAARVRFVAEPWAEVRVDDATPFLTPRAERIPLAPGRHRVVFLHPTLGSAEEVVVLGPGEERIVRHVFGSEEGR